jgi:hypothetical protein
VIAYTRGFYCLPLFVCKVIVNEHEYFLGLTEPVLRLINSLSLKCFLLALLDKVSDCYCKIAGGLFCYNTIFQLALSADFLFLSICPREMARVAKMIKLFCRVAGGHNFHRSA